MKRVLRHKIDGKEVLFFGTIKGLVSEREMLKDIFMEFSPELMLLGISPEQMDGLRKYLEEPFEIDPEDYEIIYGLKLEKYGEVGLPVPTYLEAFALSEEHGVPMEAIDMPEDEFSDLFVRKVDIFHIFRYNFRRRKLWRMDFQADTPEEFVLSWDREVNRIRVYREIEGERERYMSERIREIVGSTDLTKILVIVELERLEGVLQGLNLLQTTQTSGLFGFDALGL